MLPRLLLAPLLLASFISLISLFSLVHAQSLTESQTLLRTIRNSAVHKVFSRLLPIGPKPLDEILGNPSIEHTVFAPTDSAFAILANAVSGKNIPASNTNQIIQALRPFFNRLPGTPSAIDILFYHAIPSSKTIAELQQSGDAVTASQPGYKLKFPTNAGLVVVDADGTSSISASDIKHVNGYLNIVERVLLPVPSERLLVITSTTPSASPSAPTPSASISPKPTSDVVPSSEPSPFVSPVSAGNRGESSPSGTDSSDEDDAQATPNPSPGDDDDDDDDGICFPASSRVTTSNGASVRMDELTAGTHIAHSSSAHSPVFLFTHRTNTVRARFVRVETACKHTVTLTANHYVRSSTGSLIAAGALRPQVDSVMTISGPCAVRAVHTGITNVGLYAPHTTHGDLVVDGVVCSSYSRAVHPRVAHALLAPVRFFVRTTGVTEPLGKTFYNGAEWALRILPRGRDHVTNM